MKKSGPQYLGLLLKYRIVKFILHSSRCMFLSLEPVVTETAITGNLSNFWELYPQLTVTITINSLQELVITGTVERKNGMIDV